MSNAALPEAILIAEAVPSAFEAAAGLLDQAVRAGRQEPEALYLLALACKRQGMTADARAAFRKIARPDANVWLQLGIPRPRPTPPAAPWRCCRPCSAAPRAPRATANSSRSSWR